jgi:hypothetical protein
MTQAGEVVRRAPMVRAGEVRVGEHVECDGARCRVVGRQAAEDASGRWVRLWLVAPEGIELSWRLAADELVRRA